MGCRPENRIQRISLYYNIPSFFFLLFLFSTTTLASFPNDRSIGHHIVGEISWRNSSRSTDGGGGGGRGGGGGGGGGGVYFYSLHNRCSGRFVTVKQRFIRAKAKNESHYAWLRIEPVNFGGRIRMRSNTSDYYLCFNANGHLTVKFSDDESQSCTFKEQFKGNGYIQFRSEANPDWFIGFNGKGHRLAGNQWKRERKNKEDRKKCFQFMRIGHKKLTLNGTVDVKPPQGDITDDRGFIGKNVDRYANDMRENERSKDSKRREKRHRVGMRRKPK